MLRDLLQESYNAMRHNRRRTALTMLGMAWGIATVVMLLAYGDGFGRACANIFANFGTKLFIVVPGRSSMQSGGEKAGALLRLTLDDVDLLSTNIPQITHITPDCFKRATVQYDTRSYTMSVNGEYPNTFAIRALGLAQGRFYNPEDQMQRARVAVIGSETKEKLFSGRNALGEYIRLDGISFEVVGVLSAKMQAGDDNIIASSTCPLPPRATSRIRTTSTPSGSITKPTTINGSSNPCVTSWPLSINSIPLIAARCLSSILWNRFTSFR